MLGYVLELDKCIENNDGDVAKGTNVHLVHQKVAELEKEAIANNEYRGASRSRFYHSEYGAHVHTTCKLDISLPHGTHKVYFIEAYYNHTFPARNSIVVDTFYHNDEAYWERHVKEYDESTVIIDGTHYRLGKPVWATGDTSFRGFGGRVSLIKFHDGREVKTNNLWYQGPIPPVFRDRLTDNAEFVENPLKPMLMI